MTNEIKRTITLKASAAEVWDALTNPEKIKHYLFGTQTTTDWKVGSPIVFSGMWEDRPYEDKGTILAIEPGKSLTYSYWSNFSGTPDVPENYANITYLVEEKEGEILLTVAQDGFKDDESAERSANDWGMVLDGIKTIVEKA